MMEYDSASRFILGSRTLDIFVMIVYRVPQCVFFELYQFKGWSQRKTHNNSGIHVHIHPISSRYPYKLKSYIAKHIQDHQLGPEQHFTLLVYLDTDFRKVLFLMRCLSSTCVDGVLILGLDQDIAAFIWSFLQHMWVYES